MKTNPVIRVHWRPFAVSSSPLKLDHLPGVVKWQQIDCRAIECFSVGVRHNCRDHNNVGVKSCLNPNETVNMVPWRLSATFAVLAVLAGWFCAIPLAAQEAVPNNDAPEKVLTAKQWKDVDQSVDRALTWLASQQQPDGSFPTLMSGQPGVTGLCALAFLAQGHVPNEGEYGQVLAKSLDYIKTCQRQNGWLAATAPNEPKITRNAAPKIGVAASYSHAMSGLVLCEAYAMSGAETTDRIQPAIEKALNATFEMQDWAKERKVDAGGWRYLQDSKKFDSDLSVTGWHLMFLRSAKNAGFEVEKDRIDRAVGYVRRCFQKDQGSFAYKLDGPKGNRTSRAMAGAGILALAHSGLHETDEAKRAGDWILKCGFRDYNKPGRLLKNGKGYWRDRYFYGLLICAPAMYQLGDHYWRDFFPPAVEVLIKNQHANGSWDAESHYVDNPWGNAYTTAIGVLALSASNELLPIFQR